MVNKTLDKRQLELKERLKKVIVMLLIEKADLSFYNDITESEYDNLIALLVMIKYDVRWCSHVGCGCHPETELKNMLIDKDNLSDLLKALRLYDEVFYLLNNIDQTSTVFDLYGVK